MINRLALYVLFVFYCFNCKAQTCNDNLVPILGVNLTNVCSEDFVDILVLNENFDNPNEFEKNWKIIENVGRENEELTFQAWFQPENVDLDNGNLNLSFKNEAVIKTPYGETTPRLFLYTGAEIISNFRYKYGSFEIKCKIPKGDGLVPAFWLYGQRDHEQIPFLYLWNEIDVFEFTGNTNIGTFKQNSNVIYGFNENNGQDLGFDADHCSTPYPLIPYFDFSAGWHTYRVDWTPTYIKFYTDGNLIRADYKYYYKDGSLNTYPALCGNNYQIGQNGVFTVHENVDFPDEPMNVLLTIDGWQNYKNIRNDQVITNCNTLPAKMEVEYCNIYVRRSCISELEITDENLYINNNSGFQDRDYDIKMAKNITSDGIINIEPNKKLKLIANNKISLKSGFKVKTVGTPNEARHIHGLHLISSPDFHCGGEYRVSDIQNSESNKNQTKFYDYSTVAQGIEYQNNNTLLKNERNNVFLVLSYPTIVSKEIKIYSTYPSNNIYASIRNILGQELIGKITIDEGNNYIDLSGLTNGVYFINYYSESNNLLHLEKFVKN